MQKGIPKNNLLFYREMVSLSQKNFARKCGVATVTIHFIENHEQAPRPMTRLIIYNTLLRLKARNKEGKPLKLLDVFPM